MSSINLTVQFTPIPGTSYNLCQYARIDNTATPVFINAPNVVTSPTTIATNIPDGQYQINLTPIYPDGRTCTPTSFITPPCAPLISISAYINSGTLVVNYLAPSGTPQVQINVAYPNGGTWSQMYVNNGTPISIALPPNLYGNYTVTGQSVCDPVSGFYSALSQTVTVVLSQPTPNTYSLSNSQTAICGVTPATYYTAGGFQVNTTLFTDSTLATPVLGYSYVMINNIVYNLDPTTGVIGAATGANCAIQVTGNNAFSTSIPNGTGNIIAPAGTTVTCSITANGPSGGTYNLSVSIPSLSITNSVTNGTNTFSFVMPGTGIVAWIALYTSTNTTGSGIFNAS